MNCEIAAVAEDDRVRVLALAVVTDRTFLVLGRDRVRLLRDALRQIKPLFLELVHDDFEDLVCDRGDRFLLALRVERVEPHFVCAVGMDRPSAAVVATRRTRRFS